MVFFTKVNTESATSTIPKAMKKPVYQKMERNNPQSVSPITFAKFCTIFIGEADALQSISVRDSFFANSEL